MTISDWLMIIAVVAGPVLAVQVQKILERGRESRYRKVEVFRALMATRSARASLEHVRALNMIDIVFYEERKIFGIPQRSQFDKNVRDAWRSYHDQLNVAYSEDDFKNWDDKCSDLFVELLHNMAKALDFEFNKVLLKRSSYVPVAHGNEEEYQRKLRDNLLAITSGEQSLLVRNVGDVSEEQS
jgi:hypothetical protein